MQLSEIDGKLIYKIPFRLNLIRRSLWTFFSFLAYLLFQVKIEGKENVPPKGTPYIIAYNHISVLEPPFILLYWPYFVEAVAGHDVWDRGIMGKLVKWYGAIPVKRGEYDRKVMDTMKAAIESGHPIAISPEGGRSKQVGMVQAKAGVAYIIDLVNVPVVPVAFEGTFMGVVSDAFKFKRPAITMKIGKPFDLPRISGGGTVRREARQDNADMVMVKIADMLPPIYHGYYADHKDLKIK